MVATQLALQLPKLRRSSEIIRFGRDSGDADLLWEGNNLDYLEGQKDCIFDTIYIDPPFGTGSTRKVQDKHYADHLRDPEAFEAWLFPRLEHSRRLLKESGSLFVHLDYRSVHYIKVALDRLFGRNRFINEIVWCYSVGGKSRRTFARKHDTILWYSKSKEYAFYPDSIKVPRKPKSHMKVVKGENGELYQEKRDRKTGKVYRYAISLGKIPEDWWIDIETLNRGDAERSGWPTQKPSRLLERILKATTTVGDKVGDWFCGSATTAYAAQKLDRTFVMIDRESAAIECAKTRLENSGIKMAEEGIPPRNIQVYRLSDDTAQES